MSKDFSMPLEWLEVMNHPSVKDKASLLMKLKYEMTIEDVHDLKEYQEYENWLSHEEYLRQNKDKR